MKTLIATTTALGIILVLSTNYPTKATVIEPVGQTTQHNQITPACGCQAQQNLTPLNQKAP